MKLQKSTLILFFVVLIGPILDLLIGYFQRVLGSSSIWTPGVVYRGFILIPIFTFMTFQVKSYLKPIILYFLAIFIISNAIYVLLNYPINLVSGMQRFLKLIFPFLGIGAMIYLTKKYPNKSGIKVLWKTGTGYGIIIAVSVIFLFVTGQGLATYRSAVTSSKGFFAQNSAGLSLAVSFPLTLFYIFRYKNNNPLYIFLTTGLYLGSAFLLSTRAALLTMPFTLAVFQLYITFHPRYNRNIIQTINRFIIFLGIVIVGAILFWVWYRQDISFILYKFRLLFQGEFRREVPNGILIISKFTPLQHLIGIGDAQFPLTENDLIDTYGKFGLLTLLPLLGLISTYYFRILFMFIKRNTLSSLVLSLCLTYYVIHASFAGHAFIDALTNNLMILVYYLIYLEIKAPKPYKAFQKIYHSHQTSDIPRSLDSSDNQLTPQPETF